MHCCGKGIGRTVNDPGEVQGISVAGGVYEGKHVTVYGHGEALECCSEAVAIVLSVVCA